MQRVLISLIFVYASVAQAPEARGAGDLLVMPTRIVFEERTRTAELGLVNTGREKAIYRISLVNQRMTRDGRFEPVTAAESPTGERFADRLVRYYPRQVVLEPGASQTVRLQVRKPAKLPVGEYRSHLMMRAVPEAVAAGPANGASDEFQVVLQPIYGVSIPVIVRHGTTEATASLERPSLVRARDGGGWLVKLVIKRAGTESLYGNLEIEAETSNGTKQTIGAYRGVAVYTPNTEREILIPLQVESGGLSKGALRAYFYDADSNSLLATSETRFR